MITCHECKKLNTLDSLFCRSCGHALPEDERLEARKKNDELVTEGLKLLADGRQEEALMVADKALEADPSHIQALSLKGDLLERSGDLLGALHHYERVVDASPDNALDRIKLEHVRRLLTAPVAAAPAPNRRAALGAAIAATCLVASLGVLGAVIMQTRSAANTPILAQEDQGASSAPMQIASNTPANPGTNPAGAPNPPYAREISPEEYQRLMREAQAQAGNNAANGAGSSPTTPNTGGRLPSPSTNGQTTPLEGEVRPLQPQFQITPVQPNEQPSGGSNTNAGNTAPARPSVDPDPTTPGDSRPNPGGNSNASGTQSTPQRNPGTIDIRPSQNQPTRVGGSQTIPESNGTSSRDLLARARQFFMTGDFASAAAAYEQALRAGADPGSTNQRLGQCYERLGRKADAIRAYTAAAQAFSARVQANPNNEAARTALEAVNGALNNLRG